MVEPDQQDFNKHFMDLAEGKIVGDSELQALSHRGLGGRRHQAVNYKMAFDPNPKTPRPIQNVTSEIASSVNQAKSRLGEAIKLGEEETGISPHKRHRRNNTSHSEERSHKKKKKKHRDKKEKDRHTSSHSKQKRRKKSKKK